MYIIILPLKINLTRFFFSRPFILKRTFKKEAELTKKIFEKMNKRDILFSTLEQYNGVTGIFYQDKIDFEIFINEFVKTDTLIEHWPYIKEQKEYLNIFRKWQMYELRKNVIKEENELKSLCFKYWFRKKSQKKEKINKKEINYQKIFINGIHIKLSQKSPFEFEKKNKKTKKVELFVPDFSKGSINLLIGPAKFHYII